MILFTSPKEFQDVRAYKMILSQKTFVSVSQTPFAISTSVFRGSESILYYPGFKNINTTDYFPSDDPFFLLLLTKEKLSGYLLFCWFWTPL